MKKDSFSSSSILLLLVFLFLIGKPLSALYSNANHPSHFDQTRPGSIRGVVTDITTGECIPFAPIYIKIGEKIIKSVTTNMDGEYMINPVEPGKYDLYCLYVGYADYIARGVNIEADRPRIENIRMTMSSAVLQEIAIVWEAPLIDGTKTAKRVSGEEVMNMAVRDINAIAAPTAGVTSSEETDVRGSRATTSIYFIDGVRVSGNAHPEEQNRARAGNESYEGLTENAFQEALSLPYSTFAIDVDAASYSNSRRFLKRGQLPPKDAVRIEEFINYFQYDYSDPTGKHPFSVHTELSACPWNKSNRLLHIGIQGKRMEQEALPPSNLVFLIDVSGSMSSMDKLPLLKSAFSMLLNKLNAEDRIAIVVYAGAAGLVLPSTSCDKKEVISQALNSLNAGGSTAGGAGIQLAYQVAEENKIKGGNNSIILATDGDFNVGISSSQELTQMIEVKRESGIYLSVLGFGTGNYKDAQMEKLANHGNGNFNYIDNMLEAEKVLINEMGGTLVTIAKDVKIQMEFNPAVVKEYRLIGFENRMLEKKDFEDDRKDAGELGAGHSVTALYEIVLFQSSEEGEESSTTRYQSTVLNSKALKADEIGMVHFRYKKPDGGKSILLEQAIENQPIALEASSNNFRFSAAVAEFGLLIKDSEYKEDANYEELIGLAKGARGEDPFGYRAEFIRLAEVAQGLQLVGYQD